MAHRSVVLEADHLSAIGGSAGSLGAKWVPHEHLWCNTVGSRPDRECLRLAVLRLTQKFGLARPLQYSHRRVTPSLDAIAAGFRVVTPSRFGNRRRYRVLLSALVCRRHSVSG